MGQLRLTAIGLAALGLVASAEGGWANEPGTAGEHDWTPLFNGRDLDGWTAKIRHHEPGDNHADTFRVEDGLLTVSYDGYQAFDDRFGHLFHKQPFSHYRLRLEYRFIGPQAPGGRAWARRNSGVMLHAQAPETMPAAQDFPISLEAQFLGGLGDGKPRPTGNLCTPGTNVHVNGEFTEQHCIASTSPTFDGDQWIEFEVRVLGGDRITHYVNGEAVMAYTDPSYGGGVVNGHRPEAKPDGEPLGEGYIALQSESHPIQFRNIRLLSLKGCMNPKDAHYRDYFVAHEPSACAAAPQPQ
ncbi:MAG: DUF1080 domain-containing protein [Gammaproteobacteria bacterium]|nr:DUF1080 domain-containing protein [Gammaproteobacteria bacterium]